MRKQEPKTIAALFLLRGHVASARFEQLGYQPTSGAFRRSTG